MESDLYQMVAHELRNPLSLVKGCLDAVFEDYADDMNTDMREYLEMARSHATRMLELVSAAVYLLRLRGGEIEVQRATIDVGAILQAAAGRPTAAAEERGVALRVETSGDLVMDGDDELIERALRELLGEAVTLTETGTVIGAIASRQDDGIEIRVEGPSPLSAAPLPVALMREVATIHGGRMEGNWQVFLPSH